MNGWWRSVKGCMHHSRAIRDRDPQRRIFIMGTTELALQMITVIFFIVSVRICPICIRLNSLEKETYSACCLLQCDLPNKLLKD